MYGDNSRMLYKQAMPILSSSDRSTSKSKRNMRIGQTITGTAVAYPFLVYAIVWSHYAVTHRDLSKQAQAIFLLLVFPILLGCAFSLLIFIADGRGKKRAVGVIGTVVGVIVNVLFLLANGTV
jgi:hypothetical protein